MIRLLFSDLRAHAASWFMLFLVMCTSGAAATFGIQLIIAGDDDTASFGGVILGFATISTFFTVSSLAGLLFNERRRAYAQWKLAGAHPLAMSLGLLGQITGISVCGTFIGGLLGGAITAPAIDALRAEGLKFPNESGYGTPVLLGVMIGTGSALLTVLPIIIRMIRSRPIKVLAESTLPAARRGIVETLLGIMFLISLIALFKTESGKGDLESQSNLILGGQMITLLVTLLLSGWLLPSVFALLAGLVRAPFTARIAAYSIHKRSAFSMASTVPWILTGTVLVSMYTAMQVVEYHTHIDTSGQGGWVVWTILLGPALIPPLIGALCSFGILLRRNKLDAIALTSSGADKRHLISITVWESALLTIVISAVVIALSASSILYGNFLFTSHFFADEWQQQFPWQRTGAFILFTFMSIAVANGMTRVMRHS